MLDQLATSEHHVRTAQARTTFKGDSNHRYVKKMTGNMGKSWEIVQYNSGQKHAFERVFQKSSGQKLKKPWCNNVWLKFFYRQEVKIFNGPEET
jgi:hypothetical protein